MALLLLMLPLVTVASPHAGASPIDDKRAEARRLQAQIDATGERIGALGEQYDGAVLAIEQAKRATRDAEARLAVTKRQWNLVKAVLSRRAADLYMAASNQNPLADVDVAGIDALMARSSYSAAIAQSDNNLLSALQATRDDLQTRTRALDAARRKAETERDKLVATRHRLETENAREASLLGKVKGELATLIAQERARQEAAARARAAAEAARLAAQERQAMQQQSVQSVQSSSGGLGRASGVGPDTPLPAVPAPSGGAATAVAYARRQLGKPYIFDTAGPATFDCSGLTMMAWAAAGVSMPHYSGAQFSMFPHVPLGALQPGDLVFKGPGGSVHVAIYVGNGMQIAATHTGSFVLLQPVDYPHLSGAVRPG